MINLNLISGEQREYLRQKANRFIYEKLFVFIFFIFFIISLTFGFGKNILLNNYNDLISYGENQKLNNFSSDITNLNNKIKIINKIQNDYSPIAETLSLFIKVVPDKIFISNLKLEKDTSEKDYFWLVKINGKAKTRDDLMRFQSNLEQVDGFSEVEFPISNLLKRSDIDFQFTAKLTPKIN